MNIVVGIATAGRRELLSEVIRQLALQTRMPDCVSICPASEADVDEEVVRTFPGRASIIRGKRGSAHQRNAIIRAATDADVIVFFDDDFMPQPSYVAEIEQMFREYTDLVVTTGVVLADGIHGPGLSIEESRRVLDEDRPIRGEGRLETIFAGYGCNMALRLSVARAHGLEFDENLPSYAWWEDVDLSRRMARYGSVAKSDRLRGVHLGVKAGRASGRRLGYSQVANPTYLASKGTISKRLAALTIAKHMTINLGRSFASEPWIDRRGRAIGNMLALCDLVLRRLSPERIRNMK